MTTTLEAFAVLVYCNSYEVWNERCKQGEGSSTSSSARGVDELSTLSGGSIKTAFKYTGDSRGCQKYRGWSSEGLTFYNDLLDLVEEQRNRPGCTFEEVLLTTMATKPRDRGAAQGTDNPATARNHMNLLVQMIGI